MSCENCGFICGGGADHSHDSCPCCGAPVLDLDEEEGGDTLEPESPEDKTEEVKQRLKAIYGEDLPIASTKEMLEDSRKQNEKALKNASESNNCPVCKEQMNRAYRCKKCKGLFCVNDIYEHETNCAGSGEGAGS